MGDRKRKDKAAKPGEQKCLKPYRDRHGIERRCQRPKKHFPFKCS